MALQLLDSFLPAAETGHPTEQRDGLFFEHLVIFLVLAGAFGQVCPPVELQMPVPVEFWLRRCRLRFLHLGDRGLRAVDVIIPDGRTCPLGQLVLHRRLLLADPVGDRLIQPAGIELLQQLRHHVIPDRVQPCDLAFAHRAGLGHMVAHAAFKLHALLAQLVEDRLDALGLLGDLRGRHDAGGTVGVDQAELPHGRAAFVVVDDAGDAAVEHVRVICVAVRNQHNGCAPAVAADHDIVAVLAGPDPDGLLQTDQADIVSQILDALQRVKVVGIRVQQLQLDVNDLLLAGVRFRYGAEHIGDVKRHDARLPS